MTRPTWRGCSHIWDSSSVNSFRSRRISAFASRVRFCSGIGTRYRVLSLRRSLLIRGIFTPVITALRNECPMGVFRNSAKYSGRTTSGSTKSCRYDFSFSGRSSCRVVARVSAISGRYTAFGCSSHRSKSVPWRRGARTSVTAVAKPVGLSPFPLASCSNRSFASSAGKPRNSSCETSQPWLGVAPCLRFHSRLTSSCCALGSSGMLATNRLSFGSRVIMARSKAMLVPEKIPGLNARSASRCNPSL